MDETKNIKQTKKTNNKNWFFEEIFKGDKYLA